MDLFFIPLIFSQFSDTSYVPQAHDKTRNMYLTQSLSSYFSNSDRGIELHSTRSPQLNTNMTNLSVSHRGENTSPRITGISQLRETQKRKTLAPRSDAEETFKTNISRSIRSMSALPTHASVDRADSGRTGTSLRVEVCPRRRLQKSASLRVHSPVGRLTSSVMELSLSRRRRGLRASGDELRAEFEMVQLARWPSRRRQEG